jgi:hypothetical protein
MKGKRYAVFGLVFSVFSPETRGDDEKRRENETEENLVFS